MTAYTWEPIPEGETPEWGEWIKMGDAAGDGDVRLFVGVDPASNRWVTTHQGTPEVWWAPSGWLRRVKKPHRWEAWANEYPDAIGGNYATLEELTPFTDRTGAVHFWCDADGELHIERVDD